MRVSLSGVQITSTLPGLCRGYVAKSRSSYQHLTAHNVAAMSTAQPTSPSGLGFIDVGANLLDAMFQGVYNEGRSYHPPDLNAVLQRAWDAGVQRIIITAGSLAEAQAALALARTDGEAWGGGEASSAFAEWLPTGWIFQRLLSPIDLRQSDNLTCFHAPSLLPLLTVRPVVLHRRRAPHALRRVRGAPGGT